MISTVKKPNSKPPARGMEAFLTRVVLAGAVFAAVLAFPGCSSKSDLATVTGTVTYQGEPIKKGHIVMEPATGRSARGTIVDGQIVGLHTYEAGDGVRVGTHQVSIIAFIREPKGMEIVPSAIPERYRDPGSSGLTATIEAGKTNELLFELVK